MKHITFEERQKIEIYLKKGFSIRKIGKKLNRDHTVIKREIDRNSGAHFPYNAELAQKAYERRKFGKKNFKLETNLELRTYVINKIREDLSPDQISGRLKKLRELGESPPGQVSHETIYQFLFSKQMKATGLWKHLRTRRSKRRKWGRKHRGNKIPNRVSIHHRPLIASLKKEVGHWEVDTVVSCIKGKGGLSTHYEKMTQYCKIQKLLSKEAQETEFAWRETISSLPQDVFKTITLDNGSENTNHEVLHEYNIDTYFCDAYCSWQKGGVENLNKLIRQYFPKGTDFSDVSEEEILFVENKLNNRPRKFLGYLSPNEVLNFYIWGGAFNT